MAKDDHKKIDAILALPLKKGGDDDDDRPTDDDDDGDVDDAAAEEALSDLGDVLDVPEDKREAFAEAMRKVIEAVRA